jgi:ABC-type transport system substrate-binding protein
MNTKIIGAIVIAVIAVAAVAGAVILLSTPQPVTQEKAIVAALYSSTPTLDAPQWTGTDLQTISWCLYDRLVDINNQSQIVPSLAKSWTTSADGLIWTFYLQSGVKFTDGTDFNAAAVKYNFDRIIREKIPNSYKLYSAINQTIVVNATTVQFKLNQPYGPLLTNLAYVTGGISSPQALAAHEGNYSYYVTTTGPYKLSSYIPGSRIVLLANPDYWGGKPGLDKITFLIVSDSATRTIAMQRGETDVTMMLPLSSYQLIATQPNITTNILYERMLFFFINCTTYPKNVRLAMNYAINKTAIIQGLFQGTAEIETSPIPPKTVYAINSLTPYSYNPTLANQLLAEAGYPNGIGLNVTIETTSGSYVYDLQVAQVVQSQLQAIGIQSTIKVNDYTSHYTTRMRNANPQPPIQMAIVGWGTSTCDPDYFLKSLFYGPLQHGSSYNIDYNNATVNTLIDQAAKESNPTIRASEYTQIQTMIWQDAPGIWLYTIPEIFAWKNNVHGVQIMPTGAVNLKMAYLS